MIKYYCDICGNEITESNNFPAQMDVQVTSKQMLGLPKNHITLSLILDDAVDTGKHCCRYCVYDAVKNQDDRPRDVSEERSKSPA